MKQTLQILKLIRGGNSFEIRKEDQRSFTVIGILIVLLVIVPGCVAAGFITYVMTLAFIEAGGGHEGLLFVIQFLSAFAMVFGFSVIINEFYFSSDIDFLLPLPVKAEAIISAKFMVTYLAECGMEILVIISAWAGYIIAAGPSVKNILLFLPVSITLPLVPLLYCGFISFIVMRAFAIIKSRRVLNIFMTVLSIILLTLAILSFGGLKGLTVENFIATLRNEENSFMRIMNIMFYPSYLLIKTISQNELSGMILYFLLSGLALILFILLAKLLYIPGLAAYKSAADKKSIKSVKIKNKRQSAFSALVSKELKMLFRTSGFVTNCILINIFWPVIVVIVILMQKGSYTIERFILTYHLSYVLAHITLIIAMLSLAALTAAGNGLASSAITREGSSAFFMKYIPVPYRTQLFVKTVISIVISLISYVLDVLIIKHAFWLSINDTLYYLFAGTLVIIIVCCLGLLLDTKNPKQVWEDEVNALRANLGVFLNMAEAIMISLITVIMGVVLYFIKSATIGIIRITYMLLLLIITIVLVVYTIKKSEKNIENLEP